MKDKIIKVLKSYIARSKDDSKDSYDEYISSFAEALASLEAGEEETNGCHNCKFYPCQKDVNLCCLAAEECEYYIKAPNSGVKDRQSAEEILAKCACIDFVELRFKNEVQIIRPSEALEAMEEYASQGMPTEEELREIAKRFEENVYEDMMSPAAIWFIGANWVINQINKSDE